MKHPVSDSLFLKENKLSTDQLGRESSQYYYYYFFLIHLVKVSYLVGWMDG